MKLEDYINNYKNPKKEKPKLEFAALELYYYKDIDRKKKKLIRSAFNYLGKDNFYDALERRENAFDEYAYYQSESVTGIRGLIRIETCDLHGSYDLTRPIPEEKFFADYNSRYMVGEQKYKEVKSLIHQDINDSDFSTYLRIFYTADGGVFLDSFSAKQVEVMTEEELGNHLADICVKEEERTSRINNTNIQK